MKTKSPTIKSTEGYDNKVQPARPFQGLYTKGMVYKATLKVQEPQE